ncbi:MAG: hypothetical protein GY909_03985 [Oligoflexia bacterium]|nr:hypothetical protein [Oligoflexia bacterium]
MAMLLSLGCSSEELSEFHVFVCHPKFQDIKTKIVHSAAKKLNVAYFDSQDQTLKKSGVIIRVRHRPNHSKSDITLKLRSDAINEKESLVKKKCEYDFYFSRKKYSCSFKKKVSHQLAQKILNGNEDILKHLDKEQMDILKSIKTLNGELKKYGIVNAQRFEVAQGEVGEDWTLEYWPFPKGTNLVEISFRYETSQAKEALQSLRNYLDRHKLVKCPKDFSKTSYTLDYFSKTF